MCPPQTDGVSLCADALADIDGKALPPLAGVIGEWRVAVFEADEFVFAVAGGHGGVFVGDVGVAGDATAA